MAQTKPKALINWSGGKDSSICLQKILQSGDYDIHCLFTTLNARYNRISQHGVRSVLLEQQAGQIGIPLKTLMLPDTPTMEAYDRTMKVALTKLRQQGVTVSIFGDIFLEDLREYRESRLAELGLKGAFPLWKRPTDELAESFISDGFRAVLVCVDERYLGNEYAGREYDKSLLNDLPDGVDPCGENGEFHTFVYDGPIFSRPVLFNRGDIVYRTYTPPDQSDQEEDDNGYECRSGHERMPETGFWFCDLIPGVDTFQESENQ
jgi:uncharacterized protein (TIGR00290 family)